MNLDLIRVASSDKGTLGVLVNGAYPLAVTCEDPWNDNQHNISCIPEGTYQCQKFTGAKFQNVWQVMNVPGRDAILIHNGNSIADTHGCILVGNSFSTVQNTPWIMDSNVTLDRLRRILPDSFTLTVKEA